MEGLRTLVEQPVVVDACALADDDLGDGVGEISRTLGASVSLHNGQVGVAASEYERARVTGVALVVEVGQAVVVHVDGHWFFGTVGNADHGDVAQERGVQGGKAVVLHWSEASQVLSNLSFLIKRRGRRDRRESQINLRVLRG